MPSQTSHNVDSTADEGAKDVSLMSSQGQPQGQPQPEKGLEAAWDVTPQSALDSSDEEQDKNEPPPDGGVRAWLMILGAWCCSFCSYGWVNSVGIFQQYYENGPLRNYSTSEISWIPSFQIFFLSFLGPLIGRLNDTYGPRVMIAIGTFLHVFGLMMASLATEYYQIMLAQGVCSAIGVACVFLPALMSVSGWFDRNRGLAFGLLSTGSSLGGVVLPILISNLLRKVGYGWTMRICAFLILGLLIIPNITVRTWTKPNPPKLSREQMLVPFKSLSFQLLLVGQFLIPFGLYAPITYLPTAAAAAGMSESLSQNLVTFYNASSLVGRASSGFLSDRLGKYNVFCVSCLTAGILVLAMWIPGHSDGVIIAFSVLFGLSSGAYISLLAALVAQISPPNEVGYRNGICFLAGSISGLTTSPISGAIMAGPGGWTGLKIFAGVMMLAGTVFTYVVKVIEKGPGLKVVF